MGFYAVSKFMSIFFPYSNQMFIIPHQNKNPLSLDCLQFSFLSSSSLPTCFQKSFHKIAFNCMSILSKFFLLCCSQLSTNKKPRFLTIRNSHFCCREGGETLKAFDSTVCIIDLDQLYLVKLGNGGSVLGLSQFLLLPQMPQKTLLDSKVAQK